MSSREDRLKDFFARSSELASTWVMPEPVFKLRTRWSSDYDRLFAEEGHIVDDERAIVDLTIEKGRAILSSRAGEGKTCMLRRVFINALQRGIAPILLDLKRWSPDDYRAWADWTSRSVLDGADFLITRFSDTGFGILELDHLPPTVEKLILVDGLNEITTAVGSQVLEIVDTMVRNQMRTSVLVADRSVRRELPSADRWSIGTILPMERDELLTYRADFEEKGAAVLKSPFFLNASLHADSASKFDETSRSAYLSQRLPLTSDQESVAAAAAYAAYFTSKSRVFDLKSFSEAVGDDVVQALRDSSDLVVSDSGEAYFSHHIVHDYLCSRYLAALQTREWTPEVFSAISFDSASFDAIAMAFEQLNGDRADAFLRALYDWNLYAAGYALGQISANEGSASIEVRAMIYAMLAEKRFDPVVATRQRASDALMLMKFDDATPFKKASSFADAQEALSAFTGTRGWFGDWKQLFLTRSTERIAIEQLQMLKDADSVIGWTMANVAKRALVDQKDVDSLGEWLDTPNATVRWRVVHVLGAYPCERNIAILRSALDEDGDRNVRYGAVRSLVELAARADSATKTHVSRLLIDRVEKITEQPRIKKELQNAIVLDRSVVPTAWLEFATEIIRAFYAQTDAIDERDSWRATLAAVETECLASNEQVVRSGRL
ncbi:HEAT repeat protein [Paraburkholderia sp. BL18I3N2]|uniref:HEAT repeat domain-containing protein n=1 Tax=Paraburkholderia sp. BL18I3N2 TaxID=1938799 RepID=UPI000D44B02C|nr:HEAT repeat domain-containing protein [Paraburkholderia sp. BL18I3N2]PRX34222.1 HEAT repeat protein [Paraburkholderia sp. BL18I3N2]